MNIEFTKRVTERLVDLKKNASTIERLIELSNQFNGGRIYNLTQPFDRNTHNAYSDWFSKEKSEDFNNSPTLAKEFFEKYVSLPAVIRGDYFGEFFGAFGRKHLDCEKELLNVNGITFNSAPVPFGSTGLLCPSFNVLDDTIRLRTCVLGQDMCYFKTCLNDVNIGEVNPFNADAIWSGTQDSFGSVVVVGDYCLFATKLLSENPDVEKITVVEEDEEIFGFLKELSKLLELEDVEFVNKKPEDYIKSHRNQISVLFIDCIIGDNEVMKYSRSVSLERLTDKNTKTHNINDSIYFSFLQGLYLKYINMKAGDENYERYFAQICPDVYNILNDVHYTINNPTQLDYYLGISFIKDSVHDYAGSKVSDNKDKK